VHRQWDQAANMPPKGNEARAAALAEMAALMHRLRTDPALADHIARAGEEPLTDVQRANLREIRRDWRNANALPESLVQARQLATRAASTRGALSGRRTTGPASPRTCARC
jgi:carboxypeptidase Taq